MKLSNDGVALSILILILMILTCHTMNYLFPRDAINTMNNSMNNTMNTKTIKQSLNKFF